MWRTIVVLLLFVIPGAADDEPRVGDLGRIDRIEFEKDCRVFLAEGCLLGNGLRAMAAELRKLEDENAAWLAPAARRLKTQDELTDELIVAALGDLWEGSWKDACRDALQSIAGE